MISRCWAQIGALLEIVASVEGLPLGAFLVHVSPAAGKKQTEVSRVVRTFNHTIYILRLVKLHIFFAIAAGLEELNYGELLTHRDLSTYAF